jgi:pyrimidine operon attenuation protein / uracil phosphoribosyltransferase
MVSEKTIILDHKQINQKINRIAWQIYEQYHREEEIVIAGIVENGHAIALRLEKILMEISPLKIKTGKISINKKNPLNDAVQTDLSKDDLTGKVLIIVDDVLDSGRTLIYGVKHFLDFPLKNMKTAVLVDRSHRIFPIKADFVGLSLATTLQEHIRVSLEDGQDKAYLID